MAQVPCPWVPGKSKPFPVQGPRPSAKGHAARVWIGQGTVLILDFGICMYVMKGLWQSSQAATPESTGTLLPLPSQTGLLCKLSGPPDRSAKEEPKVWFSLEITFPPRGEDPSLCPLREVARQAPKIRHTCHTHSWAPSPRSHASPPRKARASTLASSQHTCPPACWAVST